MTIKKVYESSIYYLTNAGLESLLEKMSTRHNNPEKSSTTKINEMHLLVIHCLHISHLIKQNIS